MVGAEMIEMNMPTTSHVHTHRPSVLDSRKLCVQSYVLNIPESLCSDFCKAAEPLGKAFDL